MVRPRTTLLLSIFSLHICGIAGAEIVSGQYELRSNEWLFVNGKEFRTMVVQYDTVNEIVLVNDFVVWEKHEPVALDDSLEVYWPENTIKMQSCFEGSGQPVPEKIIQGYLNRLGREGGYGVVVFGPCGSSTMGRRNYPEEVDQLRAIIETKEYHSGPIRLPQLKCLGFEFGWPEGD